MDVVRYFQAAKTQLPLVESAHVHLLGNKYRTWNASFRCDDIKLVELAVGTHPLGVCDVNTPRSHAGSRALIYVYLQEKTTTNETNKKIFVVNLWARLLLLLLQCI